MQKQGMYDAIKEKDYAKLLIMADVDLDILANPAFNNMMDDDFKSLFEQLGWNPEYRLSNNGVCLISSDLHTILELSKKEIAISSFDENTNQLKKVSLIKRTVGDETQIYVSKGEHVISPVGYKSSGRLASKLYITGFRANGLEDNYREVLSYKDIPIKDEITFTDALKEVQRLLNELRLTDTILAHTSKKYMPTTYLPKRASVIEKVIKRDNSDPIKIHYLEHVMAKQNDTILKDGYVNALLSHDGVYSLNLDVKREDLIKHYDIFRKNMIDNTNIDWASFESSIGYDKGYPDTAIKTVAENLKKILSI